MVAPLIIIGIIALLGGVVVFTPVGEILQETFQQTGFFEPEATEIVENEEALEEDIVGGFESFIHEMIGVGGDLGQESIEASDFEGNPIGMTQGEAEDINHKGIDFFTAFAEVFFTGHAFIVSIINGLSPVAMGIALVSIIALMVTFVMMVGHGKHILHHWVIIVMVIAGVVLLLIVLGSEASI